VPVTENAVSQRLIIALDVDSYDRAAALVESLSPLVGYFKIGSVLFTREGPRVCRLVKESGAKLFLDLKYHDIPNTVLGAVSSALDLDVDMMTLHASGGEAMLAAAVEARTAAHRDDVLLVGVTVLTHLALADFHSMFASSRDSEQTVVALARTAERAGLDGIVASARELPLIRRELGESFKVVTPGIRLAQATGDDQTRVATPARAIADGADFLVVGRPVIAADDPGAACHRILEDMGLG
jgi:orotidine-5'-phosphate decarboxylase